MKVQFEYVDFDGAVKSSEADVFEEGEWFWAVNLDQFGHGKRVSSVLAWHPVKAALGLLVGGRAIKSWKQGDQA